MTSCTIRWLTDGLPTPIYDYWTTFKSSCKKFLPFHFFTTIFFTTVEYTYIVWMPPAATTGLAEPTGAWKRKEKTKCRNQGAESTHLHQSYTTRRRGARRPTRRGERLVDHKNRHSVLWQMWGVMYTVVARYVAKQYTQNKKPIPVHQDHLHNPRSLCRIIQPEQADRVESQQFINPSVT